MQQLLLEHHSPLPSTVEDFPQYAYLTESDIIVSV